MYENLKSNWAIIAFVIGLLINSASAYIAVQVSLSKMDTRVSFVEARQDRQGEAIGKLQNDVTDFKSSLARLEANVTNLSSNVDYIRNKLDRTFP